MRSIKLTTKKGIVFWITGLSGSGKTRIGKKIKSRIIKKYGPTVLFSGDDIRQIFSYYKYSYKDRLRIVRYYSKLCRNISNQNINVIFCVVGLMKKIQDWNKNNIDNYLEIFIKSSLNTVQNYSKKRIYNQKYIQDVVGLDIKPYYPKKPHIILKNNFSLPLDKIAIDLLNKIDKAIKPK